MAFYGMYADKGKRVQTGDISHFRQPYKDYTSLSGFGAIAAAYNKNFLGHLWYVNDTNVATALAQMVLVPADATLLQGKYGDAGFLAFVLQDQPAGGQLGTTASATITQFVQGGYAALLSADGTTVFFTKSAAVIAAMAGGGVGQNVATIIQVAPDLGIAADALASPAASPTLASIGSGLNLGPLGVAVAVLGAVGVGYYVFKKKRGRRATPNRRRHHRRHHHKF